MEFACRPSIEMYAFWPSFERSPQPVVMLACCVAPSPWLLMPVSALMVRPVKVFFRITLTTPAMASEP